MYKRRFHVSYQVMIASAIAVVVLVVSSHFIGANQEQSSTAVFLPFMSVKGFDHVVINELLASNGTVNMDPTISRFEDWIELYNPTSEPADLTGYYLSDDPDEPMQWQFPDGTVVAPRSHLMLSAMGFDREGLYTNFKLSDNGETVVLSAPDGSVVDSLLFDEQKRDISFGRLSDGSERTGYFGVPSPAMTNEQGLLHQDKTEKPEFSHDSGFYTDTVMITLSHAADVNTYYTIDGSTPTEASFQYTGEPIVVGETTVVKARSFSGREHPSSIVASTYLISETSELPVVSIGINPEYLWDDHFGIYVEGTNGLVNERCSPDPHNSNRSWERPITIELFEPDGTDSFFENAGVKIRRLSPSHK